jgi:sterol desaturase/sphingolipid hydroxylase (fatty acid hydroxylase superfamily)
MSLDIVNFLASPFTQFFTATERVYWVYLLSAFWIAYVLFILNKYNYLQFSGQTGVSGLSKTILWHPSAINDYLFFYTDMLFHRAFVVTLFASLSMVVSDLTEVNLKVLLPSFNGRLEGLYGMTVLMTLLFALVADASLYFCHFLQHKIPLLWEFHKVHHSAQVMTPITVFRMHPFDNLLVFSLGGLLSGLALGCANFLMGHGVGYYNIAGVNVILMLFYLLGYNLTH